MAGGGFNTVGVKPSDSATAVICRHLFNTRSLKTVQDQDMILI